MTDDVIETLDEVGHWRSRDVVYYAGRWEQVRRRIPHFEKVAFQASPEGTANPYMQSVVRLPRTKFEQVIPVGTVSNSYTLAQHDDVAEKCFEGLRRAGIETDELRCELGLTELGEWMNLRIYFPDEYSYTPKDKHQLGLRLECFNSVDGSSRLVVLLGWLRLVCSNGMVINETRTELRDIHNRHLNLEKIPEVVLKSLDVAHGDVRRLSSWVRRLVLDPSLRVWANTALSANWGKKAACRVYHICNSGFDVELTKPFASGDAIDKPVKRSRKVPGATVPATNLYDVSQALSWVATGRNNSEEKVEWQAAIPSLIERLGVTACE